MKKYIVRIEEQWLDPCEKAAKKTPSGEYMTNCNCYDEDNFFSDIIQPPDKIKDAWRKMIPDWAWKAMVDDTKRVLKSESERKSSNKDIERLIRNKHIFIRREAFLPECFLPDIIKEAIK